jgi:Alpha-kinase family
VLDSPIVDVTAMTVPGSTRCNNASRATVNRNIVFGHGSFKVVYKGMYTEGKRAGEACVCKEMRSGSTWLDSAFDKEEEVVNRAAEIVDKFNNAGHINLPILMNSPEVWHYEDDCGKLAGSLALIEPFIHNFQKFNSNSGWVLQDGQNWTEVMQVPPALTLIMNAHLPVTKRVLLAEYRTRTARIEHYLPESIFVFHCMASVGPRPQAGPPATCLVSVSGKFSENIF